MQVCTDDNTNFVVINQKGIDPPSLDLLAREGVSSIPSHSGFLKLKYWEDDYIMFKYSWKFISLFSYLGNDAQIG